MHPVEKNIGVVVIGRNEGKTLRATFRSVGGVPCAYVDSGSDDNSVGIAQSMGFKTIPATQPYSAAGGRNLGWKYLIREYPSIEWIQFLDGDSRLHPTWLTKLRSELAKNETWSAVFGHIHENNPGASLFMRLLDMEWESPQGEAIECPGIVAIRRSVLEEIEGYNEAFLEGEDSEISCRIKKRGGTIWKMNAPMAIHAGDLNGLSGWMSRTYRSGVGIGKNSYSGIMGIRRKVSTALFGAVFPFAILLAFVASPLFSLTLLFFHLLTGTKIYLHRRRIFQNSRKHSLLYSFFCLLGKIPECAGMCSRPLQKCR